MVGEDSWLVALGSPADHHMQHPIRGFNVMFLQQQQQQKNYFSKESQKLQAGHVLITNDLKWISWEAWILYSTYI